MNARLHNSWSDMEWRTFQTVHGFCPLCCEYHDLFLERNLYYCPQQNVNDSGWTAELYNKLITSPQSVDISQYSDVKYRTIRSTLLRTLPFMIENRAKLDSKIESAKNKASNPQVIIQKVQPLVLNRQPVYDQGYWNRVADSFGF